MTEADLELGVDELNPLVAFQQSHIIPAAVRLGIDPKELEELFRQSMHALPQLKRQDVWKFASEPVLEDYVKKWIVKSKRRRKLLAIIGIDLRNIGGLNARFGETKVNEIIDCLLDLLIAAVKDLCSGVEDAEWSLVHYGGGDEYLLLISGIDEFALESFLDKDGIQRTRTKKTLTKALDTLVRDSVRWAISVGLGNTRHPKHWSTEHWGTGIFYGVTFVHPEQEEVDVKKAIGNSFKICQQCKRGIKPGEVNPLELPLREQIYRFLFIFVGLFNRLCNTNYGWKSEWKRPGS